MHKQKLRNILKLPTIERFEYSIREFVKHEEIWAASTDESWIMFSDGEDTIFPIWPHKELVDICLLSELRGLDWNPTKINLEKFVDFCIPDMEEEKVLFGVFYNEHREGLAVYPDKLRSDIIHEIEMYE